MPSVSPSALSVPHSRIRELADIATGMDGVIKLYFGESNLPTPEYLKQAARAAMDAGYTYYTENAGLASLREALASYYAKLHGVDLDPSTEIVVTASGVQALNLGLRCLVDPGDDGIVLTPAWPNESSILSMHQARARQVPHPVRNGRCEIDFDALEQAATPRTRLILYTSPSNPLGWVATEDDQERLLEFARRKGLWLVADEVYERIYYLGRTVPSILRKCTREDAVLVIQSFSKSYCMTGWRLGWLIGRKDLVARAAQLNEFVVSCAPAFVQKAAETALSCGEKELEEMVARLKHNRDFCLSALAGMPGVTLPRPDGAFYLFPRIEAAADSFGFCKELLLETKVGLAPGIAFGEGGEGSVRICYASEQALLEEAIARLKSFLS